MTPATVIPAKAGTSGRKGAASQPAHNLAKIPAFAGMTLEG
jgi:hypothetical protein